MMEREGIACIGLTVWDTIKTIQTYPAEGRYAEVQHTSGRVGGNVPNVLIDIAMIDSGIPLFAVSELGCDSEGDSILSSLRNFDIEVSPGSPKYRTENARIRHNESRDTGSRTIFYQRGASHSIGLEFLENIELPAKIVQIAYLGALPGLEVEALPDEHGESSSNYAPSPGPFSETGL